MRSKKSAEFHSLIYSTCLFWVFLFMKGEWQWHSSFPNTSLSFSFLDRFPAPVHACSRMFVSSLPSRDPLSWESWISSQALCIICMNGKNNSVLIKIQWELKKEIDNSTADPTRWYSLLTIAKRSDILGKQGQCSNSRAFSNSNQAD